VWELTLACDQRCTHCGSRAAEAREHELDTAQALDVVRQLIEAGAQEVSLIGGEAYLHPGFLEVVSALRDADVRPSMTSGGRGIDAALAQQIAAAGMYNVSISIDGLQPTHDLLRATRGGFESAMAALRHLRAAGVHVGCNTTVSALNIDELEPLYELLKAAGIGAWQVQLVAALGRAADRPDMLVEPWQLLELVPRIARLKERAYADDILLMPGNNVGYFSHDERLLRSTRPSGRDFFAGCQAGRYVMGIESDGAVKGCPSLQTAPYVGGSLRDAQLSALWETPQLAFVRKRTVDDLWGFCRTCPFAETCMGGCTFTAHALFGKPGNNPYCHYRVKTLAADGLRERLIPRVRAPGEPFDSAIFELVTEPIGQRPAVKPRRAQALKVWPSQ
jgi:radical SAM protein with 4Fe4S-binding SPASM domain